MTDFSSIEAMMEFGLGLGVARQMADTMNHAMSNMQVPGTGYINPPKLNTGPQGYYAVISENVAGPLTEDDMATLIRRGDITSATLVWRPGQPQWAALEKVPEAYKLLLLNS